MKKEIVLIVKEVVSLKIRENGWARLADVGAALNSRGIRIKDLGYIKLKPFIEDMPDFFELSIDESTSHPLVRIKDSGVIDNISKKEIVSAKEELVSTKEEEVQTVHLTNWASIDLKAAIKSLSELALPEKWAYKDVDDEYPMPILAQYLKWTFVKLMREKKIMYEGDYAAFNTGLVDGFYQPIYAVFDRNKIPKQPWHFINFCTAGSKSAASHILCDNFATFPERATYIKHLDDVIFDYRLPIDVNWEHIVIDNIERIPSELLRQICGEGIEIRNIEELIDEDKLNYIDSLRSFLKNNQVRLHLIANMVEMAVQTAIKRVAWNYKTAIPVYYPTTDKVNLILPLSLNIEKPEEISLALVMTKTPAKRYRAVTIFTLEMAYSNARLITKPSNEWLNVELS